MRVMMRLEISVLKVDFTQGRGFDKHPTRVPGGVLLGAHNALRTLLNMFLVAALQPVQGFSAALQRKTVVKRDETREEKFLTYGQHDEHG